MDYYYDPEVAAEVAAWVNYICPVAGRPGGDGEDRPGARRNQLIFPTDAVPQDNNVKVFRR